MSNILNWALAVLALAVVSMAIVWMPYLFQLWIS
jgi:hypothetical protein